MSLGEHGACVMLVLRSIGTVIDMRIAKLLKEFV
jgi:hypothetical protein